MIVPSERSQVSLSVAKQCYHCNQPLPSHPILWERGETTQAFCCQGCRTVSQIIQDSGNTQFYSLRGSEVLEKADLPEAQSWEEQYLSSPFVEEEFLFSLEDGTKEVYLQIGKVHCSACIWLNEKALSEEKGVKFARMNFATSRAKIQFDPKETNLSRLYQVIRSIGYEPKLYSLWKEEKDPTRKKTSDLLLRMGVAGFALGNIMIFGVSLYAGYFSGIESQYKDLFHYVSWFFASIAYFYSGAPFYKGAWNALKRKSLSMDFLLTLGISMAYFYSIYVTLSQEGEVYFDSVCMIYFFLLLGKYLEERARQKALQKMEGLLSNLPEVSILLTPEEQVVRSSTLQIGDRIRILAGDRIPVDGILETPQAFLDESFLTGESKPMEKKQGDRVLAGSQNTTITLEMVATSSSKNSSLSRMKKLMEDSLSQKPKLERTTERMASVFIGVVLVIATATFLGWYFFSGVGFELSLVYTIAVLIVACPCALGLAVPTALVMNHSINSEKGILLKNPDLIEILSRSTKLFLDKTGTLTTGKQKIQSTNLLHPNLSLEFLSQMVSSLEKQSKHPIAKTLTAELDNLYPGSSISIENTKEVLGKGIQGTAITNQGKMELKVGRKEFALGNESSSITDSSRDDSFVLPNGLEPGQNSPIQPTESQGIYTTIWVSVDGKPAVCYRLQDQLRAESKTEIQKLRESGLEPEILSGDKPESVALVSQILGNIPFQANLLPEDKLNAVQNAQSKGEVIIMVGDGINDGASLAKADIGISMGMASDQSLEPSDLILVTNDLSGIRRARENALLTRKTIYQNIGISLFYNSFMLPLAAFGFMLPVICAGFMTLSSLTVVGNSLRIHSRLSR